jgi:hypothetical protein
MAQPKNTIASANFDLVLDDYSSLETSLKSWNELLSTNLLTSQQLIESYFSGSSNDLDLNIDYSDFSNFVHFSSAQERVNNFVYKLQLLEMYERNLEVLATATGSVVDNVVDYFNKRSALISGFDSFERYLYEDSGSMYTHLTGSVKPWPKSAGSTPTWQTVFQSWNAANTIIDPDSGEAMTVTAAPQRYTLYATTSPEADAYLNDATTGLLKLAEDYDRENAHGLAHTIPEALAENDLICDFEPFVNMVGHHFDILWSYINRMTAIYSREEHPQDGLPNALLFDVTRAFGWELANGNQSTDLWKYSLGVDENGNLIQNNANETKPTSNVTYEIWRRILNNLPYIQRTKGTERSIRAMISCYGVPATLLGVREYGGPANPSEAPHYSYQKFNYAAEFASGAGSLITGSFTPRNTVPSSIELRFKQDEPPDATWRELFSAGGAKIEFQKTGSAGDFRGNVRFTSGSSSVTVADNYIFDGTYTTVAVTYASPVFTLYVKKLKYGKFVVDASGSFSGTWGGYASGSTYTVGAGLTGSLHEFRLWTAPLSAGAVSDHVYSPSAYNGNTETSSFDALVVRAPLSSKLDLGATGSWLSVHPDQTQAEYVHFVNMTSASYAQVEEENHLRGVTIGGTDLYSTNKVRIVSNGLSEGVLNVSSSNDTYANRRQPVDSSAVSVYFSPQNIIDEDIFGQFGGMSIDDYIGNPRDEYAATYPDLLRFAGEYWKKYRGNNVVADYVRFIKVFDFSLFQQIKKLLPLRTHALLGLVIEPNVLERSKVERYKPDAQDLVVADEFQDVQRSIAGEVNAFSGSASMRYALVSMDVLSFVGPLLVPPPFKNVANFATATSAISGTIPSNAMANTAAARAASEGSLTALQRQQVFLKVMDQVPAQHRYIVDYFYASDADKTTGNFYSSSMRIAQGNDYRAVGMLRSFHGGSRLTGAAVNVNSQETLDGGPVVSTWASNPNLLVKQPTDSTGNLMVT